MAVVRDVLEALERLAPRRHALGFDKIGLQVGDASMEVRRVAVSLDRTPSAVDFAARSGAQMLVSHHPLIFQPVATVTSDSLEGRTILTLAEHRISFAAAHTNWDAALGGINDTLARILGLTKVRPFGEAAQVENLKLVFFCPLADAERVLDAISQAGAGTIGDYSRCAFSVIGQGTFVPGDGANPTIGTPGQRGEVEEVRVETIVPRSKVAAVRRSLLAAHPYEEPAWDLVPLTPTAELPLGRVGLLQSPLSFTEFVRLIDERLQTRSLAWGPADKRIQSVAVVGGSADGEWQNAAKEGADVLVTGEVKQHVAVEASEAGFAIMSSGHYATEQPGSAALAAALGNELPGVEFVVYEPEPGHAGRPLA
jgi:dinuclear metal center YbgI/SA1388 family protein